MRLGARDGVPCESEVPSLIPGGVPCSEGECHDVEGPGGGRPATAVRRRVRTNVSGSLLGKAPEVVRRWIERYLRLRMRVKVVPAGAVDELEQLALRQQGAHAGVTKTKLRKAAAVLFARPRPTAGEARPGAA